MVTDRTRKIIERALGRALTKEEDAGFTSLAALSPQVIAAAHRLGEAGNAVSLSVYLQHVVPTATLEEVRVFMDEMRQSGASIANAPANAATGTPPPLTAEDEAALEQMRANRAKRMARYAEQGRPTPLPADSPIFEKWKDEPFQAPPPSTSQQDTQDDEDELAWQLEQLRSTDPRDRVYMLTAMASSPRANEEVLAACERLLDDRTITLLSIPYSFGEVRWIAADAVAAIRGAMGRTEAVIIEDVFAPVSTTRAVEIANEAGVPESPKGGIEGVIETLERVAAAGKLPRRRIKREPQA